MRGHASTQDFCNLSVALTAHPCTSKVTARAQKTEPCGGPGSVSWSYLHSDTCFTLRPPVKSFISTYPLLVRTSQPFWAASEGSDNLTENWHHPLRPRQEHQPIPQHQQRKHSANTFVTHANAHKKLHCKTELCKLFHTTPNNSAFPSNGSVNCIVPGGRCPPLTAAPSTLHTADSKPWTLWSVKSTFYPFWDASGIMPKQFNKIICKLIKQLGEKMGQKLCQTYTF